MKKAHKLIAIVAAMGLMLTVTACGGKAEKEQEPIDPSSLPETTKLSVYMGTYFEDEFADRVITDFKAKYPDVELEITRPEYLPYNEFENTVQKLRTELAAGKGPDLIINSGEEFLDVYKTMKSGNLLDLSSYMNSDAELNRDDYLTSVFDAGLYDGKQYMIPLSYSISVIMTSEEALADAGIEKSQFKTFGTMVEAINKNLKENPNQMIFERQRIGMEIYLIDSGVEVLDYKNEKVLVESDEFKQVMEAYKEFYPQDWVNGVEDHTMAYGDNIISLEEGRHLLTRPYGIDGLCREYRGLINNSTPVVIPFPSLSGKATTKPGLTASISSNSQNVKNAYNFIKIMLSEKAQKKLNYPVSKSALKDIITSHETGSENIINGIKENKLTASQSAEIFSAVTDIGDCSIKINNAVSAIISETMEPYFKGETDYDACLQKLKAQLEIYISE